MASDLTCDTTWAASPSPPERCEPVYAAPRRRRTECDPAGILDSRSRKPLSTPDPAGESGTEGYHPASRAYKQVVPENGPRLHTGDTTRTGLDTPSSPMKRTHHGNDIHGVAHHRRPAERRSRRRRAGRRRGWSSRARRAPAAGIAARPGSSPRRARARARGRSCETRDGTTRTSTMPRVLRPPGGQRKDGARRQGENTPGRGTGSRGVPEGPTRTGSRTLCRAVAR
jgi:hypothetical protein